MDERRKKILNMLAEGKISAEEAEKLLDAIENIKSETNDSKSSEGGKKPKFFCVRVDSDNPDKEQVNIRIPLLLIKAGVKFHSLIPGHARHRVSGALHDKGFDFNLKDMDSKQLDEILKSLQECCIDVEKDNEKVKIYCE